MSFTLFISGLYNIFKKNKETMQGSAGTINFEHMELFLDNSGIKNEVNESISETNQNCYEDLPLNIKNEESQLQQEDINYKCNQNIFPYMYEDDVKQENKYFVLADEARHVCDTSEDTSSLKKEIDSYETRLTEDENSSNITVYRCESTNCLYYSTSKSSFTRHLLIHKNRSEIKMYKCDSENCSFETKYVGNLKIHMLRHKNPSDIQIIFKCERKNCLYKTPIRAHIIKHNLMHKKPSEVKMYKCGSKQCLYETKYKPYLKTHMLIHKSPSEVTMYKCENENCSYATKHKYYLKRHMITHKKSPEEVFMWKSKVQSRPLYVRIVSKKIAC